MLGRKTLGLSRDLEKDPRSKARTNNKLYPHVAPCQNRTVAIGAGNGTRQALPRIEYAIPAAAGMCLLY